MLHLLWYKIKQMKGLKKKKEVLTQILGGCNLNMFTGFKELHL